MRSLITPLIRRMSTGNKSTIYGFTVASLDGKERQLSDYQGKVCMIINVASLCGTTTRDYHQLNELTAKYGSRGFEVLAFPCNQFGHQENCKNEEILDLLKYVRPGQGYSPQFPIFSKVTVNGKDTHPLYTFLKTTLPFPSDLAAGAGSVLMNDPKGIIWNPVRRYDISWNFEKFLIGQDGVPFGRYSPKLPPADLAGDIEKLL
uniref:Glutathione peroxidase n=1 Tax=Strongylocentrotus purpuratus TaxID=7668 RepID=A0A7M7PU75_STRPU